MSPVDEGLIHAWLEGQLPDTEAQRVAELVATDPAWEAAAAEARGLIAGTSRVLGALDHVPHVATAPAAKAASARAWWRAPWARAAAVVVFAVGTATVVWQNVPGGVDAALDSPAPAEPTRLEALSAQPPDTAAAGAQERAQTRPPAAPPPSTGAPTGRVADAAPPPPTSDLAARQAKATGAADTAARAANEAQRAVAARRDDSVANRQRIGGVVVTAPPVPLIERGVVGAAAPVASQSVDERLAGCWARIDSTGTMVSFAAPSRSVTLEASGVIAMRFIGPVVTDVVLADSVQRSRGGVGGGRGAAGGRAALLPPQPAERREIIGPFNATTRMLPDSSYVAEFVDATGRAEMTFTVSGDTLRGTMRRSAGDVRYPATDLVAVRVTCPR